MVSRRSTLKWLSAVGLAGASGTWWWRSRPIQDVPTSAPLDAPVEFDQTIGVRTSPVGLNPLRIPPLLEGEASGTEREFSLQLQEGLTRFLPDLDTPTLGFNGSYGSITDLHLTTNSKIAPARFQRLLIMSNSSISHNFQPQYTTHAITINSHYRNLLQPQYSFNSSK